MRITVGKGAGEALMSQKANALADKTISHFAAETQPLRLKVG
jgi:hypothetical protein